ncbi:MAG TPA: metal ABC transporter permease [Solirubrobacteraceae bacterium]|nr:metal ABC transporter permease [Solirubrobacteraceae bacterium]
MSELLAVAQTGFFADEPVRVALAVGTVVAIVAGVVGTFTVMRGQSFAGEALGDLGATGGSGAFLVGVGPLWGFLAMGIAAAGVMELIGIQRPRGRDLATGIVLGAGLGLAALFLYWDATLHNTTGATITILFGSVFAISSSTFPLVAVLGVAALGIVLALYRPLLLSTVSAEMAAARGVPVRVVGAAYLLALAMTVALAAVTIGAILSTALLIGPAASALRLTRRPGQAMLVAGAIGTLAVWLGVALAYESYYWPPVGRGWPVSFFVVTLIFLLYLISGLPARVQARKQGSPRASASGVEVSRRTDWPRTEPAGS